MTDLSRYWDFSTRLYGEQLEHVRERAKEYGSVSKYLRYLVKRDMEECRTKNDFVRSED